MSQSLSSVYLHLVFSTKDREPWLQDPTFRAEFHAFLGGVSKQLDCPPVVVGGVADHVHILARFARGITQSDWVKELKRVSSRWIKERDGHMAGFAWQGGYGVFSVSVSALEAVEKYILNQEEHHRKRSFADELKLLVERYGLTWREDGNR